MQPIDGIYTVNCCGTQPTSHPHPEKFALTLLLLTYKIGKVKRFNPTNYL